jgi:hypothetical protein
MLKQPFRFNTDYPARLLKGSAHILYHVAVVILSAAFAFSLPFTAAFVARKVLSYWSLVGDDKVFLVSIEIGSAVLLILLLNHVRKSWIDRRVSRMARAAGLVLVSPPTGLFARRRIKKLKEKQGFARDAMVIAATGFRTFVDRNGELYQVLHNCREAKILLLHPDSEGMRVRARSIAHAGAVEDFSRQIGASIGFLKELRSRRQNVRLKLYQDVPFLKMAILGDYLWVQHYHPGLEAQEMPKYVFKHNQDRGSLYVPFYQYFLSRWHSADIPEYDFDSDELVHRDPSGKELKRTPFTASFERLLANDETCSEPVLQDLIAAGP